MAHGKGSPRWSGRPHDGITGLRRFAVVAVVGVMSGVGLAIIPATTVTAKTIVRTRAAEVSAAVVGSHTFRLPFAAGHVALYWQGNPNASVTVSLSADGTAYGPALDAERDDVGGQRQNGNTYGAVLVARAATAARVTSDVPLGRVTVVALGDAGTSVVRTLVPANTAGAQATSAVVNPRAAWGADEDIRFKDNQPLWAPVFQTVQKVVIHHTAGDATSGDAAKETIRAIYTYHTVTQGWGDIGYNFVIDAAGVIYKGRSTSGTRTDDDVSGENALAQGVTAAHAYGYNSGTVGIALLGNFDNADPSAAAVDSLTSLLGSKAGAHGLDATGSSLYTNPLNGTQATFPNIPGHAQVPGNATACPGAKLAARLPAIRSSVAAAAGAPDRAAPSIPTNLKATAGKRSVGLDWDDSVDGGSGGGTSGLAGYEVFRQAGTKVTRLGSTTSSSFTDPAPKRDGTYHVRAFDGAANRSNPSASARVP